MVAFSYRSLLEEPALVAVARALAGTEGIVVVACPDDLSEDDLWNLDTKLLMDRMGMTVRSIALAKDGDLLEFASAGGAKMLFADGKYYVIK